MSKQRYTTDKLINRVIEFLLDNGWVIKSTNKHVKLEHLETKKQVVVSSSPSCMHAGNQMIRDLRRMGFEVCI